MIDFLSNVHVFQVHLQRGQARLGGFEVPYPQHPHDESRAAVAFVRAHELEVVREPDGRPSLAATLTHLNAAGPTPPRFALTPAAAGCT